MLHWLTKINGCIEELDRYRFGYDGWRTNSARTNLGLYRRVLVAIFYLVFIMKDLYQGLILDHQKDEGSQNRNFENLKKKIQQWQIVA